MLNSRSFYSTSSQHLQQKTSKWHRWSKFIHGFEFCYKKSKSTDPFPRGALNSKYLRFPRQLFLPSLYTKNSGSHDITITNRIWRGGEFAAHFTTDRCKTRSNNHLLLMQKYWAFSCKNHKILVQNLYYWIALFIPKIKNSRQNNLHNKADRASCNKFTRYTGNTL